MGAGHSICRFVCVEPIAIGLFVLRDVSGGRVRTLNEPYTVLVCHHRAMTVPKISQRQKGQTLQRRPRLAVGRIHQFTETCINSVRVSPVFVNSCAHISLSQLFPGSFFTLCVSAVKSFFT